MYVLYLMTEKGYKVLRSLILEDLTKKIRCVVSARDKNVQNDYYTEIKELCCDNSIYFIDKSEHKIQEFSLAFAISWRWLLPPENLIVLHDSLLPKYRGFAPLVNALINGETEIGVTALLAGKAFDTGDIVLQRSLNISYPLKIKDAINKVSGLYSEIVIGIIKEFENIKRLNVKPQDNSKASYSLWRNEEDYKINWFESSEYIKRFVDAVGYPYNGAFTILDDQTLRISDVEIIDDVIIENRDPGKVLFIEDNFPIIVCGKGLIKIKAMFWENGSHALPLKNFRTRLK